MILCLYLCLLFLLTFQIIFIDEVDSLLSKRSGNENESTLRLKNEFLIHLDGAASNEETRILVIGATNRPQELDEAVRRRFVRRLYVPLPTKDARQEIIKKIIRQVKHNLDQLEVEQLAELTEGYSGADVDTLCRYASMAPLRSLSADQMEVIEPDQVLSSIPYFIYYLFIYYLCLAAACRYHGRLQHGSASHIEECVGGGLQTV